MPMLSDLIHKALVFSSKAHRDQLRKSTDIPYISHPAAVGMILLKAGCRDELVAAGILHDCLEDADVTDKDILQEFGAEVLELVKGASEPDHHSKTWKERKQHTIDYLKSASHDVRMVACADKFHNVMNILMDFHALGGIGYGSDLARIRKVRFGIIRNWRKVLRPMSSVKYCLRNFLI